jgi:hypothetical protein
MRKKLKLLSSVNDYRKIGVKPELEEGRPLKVSDTNAFFEEEKQWVSIKYLLTFFSWKKRSKKPKMLTNVYSL